MSIWDRFRRRPKPKERATFRGYHGANTGRLFADWLSGGSKDADAEIRPALRTLRARSRDLARNSEYCARYLELLKTNTVGEGIRLQVRARADDGSLDTGGNALVEEQWALWSRVCSMDGTMTFAEAQRLFIETVARDGECLVRLVRTPTNKFGFAIQVMEADRLDEELNGTSSSGNTIVMGVEINDWGRPLRYHLYKDNPGADTATLTQNKHITLPARELIHAYRKDRPSQHRGVPWTAASMGRLKLLDSFEESLVVNARVSASKMGFFTSELDGEAYTGDDQDGYTMINEVSPGTFEQLPPGMRFESFDPSSGGQASFDQFGKAILRGISSGLGISYVSLANDLTQTSYSSIRAGEMHDRDNWRGVQKFVIDHFCVPVYQAWLQVAMENNVVPMPVTRFDKFSEASYFVARSWGWVDPQKEMAANVLGLQNGLISLQTAVSNYGIDVEELFQQVLTEKELAETMGLNYSFEPFGGTVAPVPAVVEVGD